MFGPILQYIIKERFNNFERMQLVWWPTFILHGEKDTVIPVDHSRTLADLCKGPTKLIISPTMDHCSFNLISNTFLFSFEINIGYIANTSN